MTNIKTPQRADKFTCDKCNFICSKNSDYNRHLSTAKHKIRTIRTDSYLERAKNYICYCGKEYKHASSLWNHKKKCKIQENIPSEKIEIQTEEKDNRDELIVQLVNSNTEMKRRKS